MKNQASQVSQKSEKTDQEVSQEELASSSKKRMSWQEKQEWASIEDDIAELEDMIAAVEADMQNYGSDFTKLAELQKELDQLNQDLLDKYERYEYLSELEN